MASSPPFKPPFKLCRHNTTKHTISLSQKTIPRSRPPSVPTLHLPDPPQVKVTISIKEHKIRRSARSLDGFITLERVTTNLRPKTQARVFGIVTFFVSETAEDAIHEMLADMILGSSKREFLARYLSRFAHRAAAEAGKKLIDGLELVFDFKLEEVWEYDGARVTAEVVNRSNGLAAPRPLQGLEENSCGERREFPASCPVCLEDFFFPDCIEQELMCTPCFHVFHQRCIQGWLKDTCPVCRSKF